MGSVGGGIGVSLDPSNSRRYRGGPRATGETLWGYRGAPGPQKQPREGWGPHTGPGRQSVGVPGCGVPLAPGASQRG